MNEPEATESALAESRYPLSIFNRLLVSLIITRSHTVPPPPLSNLLVLLVVASGKQS